MKRWKLQGKVENAKGKNGQPTLYELYGGDDPTVDGDELPSEVDMSRDTVAEALHPCFPALCYPYRLDRKLGEGGMGEVF